MRSVEVFLSHLDSVRPNGQQQFIARCPAHDDGRPSLSIRETDQGKILLNCWAGCSALEIVQAIGLNLADLFPDDNKPAQPVAKGRRWNFRQLLNALRFESTFVATCADDIARGQTLSDTDRARLRQAVDRIATISDVAES